MTSRNPDAEYGAARQLLAALVQVSARRESFARPIVPKHGRVFLAQGLRRLSRIQRRGLIHGGSIGMHAGTPVGAATARVRPVFPFRNRNGHVGRWWPPDRFNACGFPETAEAPAPRERCILLSAQV